MIDESTLGIVSRNDTFLDSNPDVSLTTAIITEPGNGTRYRVTFTRPDFDGFGLEGVQVTWFIDASQGNSCVIREDSFVHRVYVQEKLDILSERDAKQITRIIGYVLNLETSEDDE